jgi:O-antigen/teichoic acid export membrane protein
MKVFLRALRNNTEWQRLIRIASSSAMLTGANIASAMMMLLTIPFIIHSTGMAGYGVLVMIQAFALMLTRFFDGQAWQVYIRVVGLGYGKAAALRVGLMLDAITFLGILLAVLSASSFMQLWQKQMIPFDVGALFALSVLNQCVFSWVGVLRLEGKFRALALTTLLPALFRLFALAILSTSGALNLRTIAWIYALTEIIRFMFIAGCGWRLLGKHTMMACKTPTTAWSAVRGFTFWNWLMNLVDLPVQYVDSLLVGRFLSLELVGVYGAIKRIASVFSQISAPLYHVIFPEFTRLVAANAFSACQRLVWRSAWIMLGLGLLGMSMLYGLRSIWMPRFGLPLQYTAELFVFMTLQIGALAFTAIHPLMSALGLARVGFYIVLCSNFIFLILFYLLGQHYALMGVIVAAGVQFALVVGAKVGVVTRYISEKLT